MEDYEVNDNPLEICISIKLLLLQMYATFNCKVNDNIAMNP